MLTPKPIRFTRTSRRHRIGRASARRIGTVEPDVATDEITGDQTYSWLGPDERGRELEIVAVDRSDCVLVLHVMPTHYRNRTS